MSEYLKQRKSSRVRYVEPRSENSFGEEKEKSNIDDDDKTKLKRPNFTLMEELLLISLKDDTGETFLFNNTISMGLRACIMIELAMRNRIEMEPPGMRRRSSERRNVVVINQGNTGEPLLDEALKTISESEESDSVGGWISLLSGETWNPLKLTYQMRNLRLRVCKGLVDKGICTTSNQNMFLFSMTVYPIIDSGAKRSVITYFCNLLTKEWKGIDALSARDLGLLSICYAVEAYDFPLSSLNDTELEQALSRLKLLGKLDIEKEITKLSNNTNESTKHECTVKQIVLACLVALNNF